MAKKPEILAGRGYHHGNLRQALLDAALALIEAGEEQGVSLRTVAARAGVSNAAPYRHFKDREALMAAVATIGFERLLQSLRRARESAGEGAELLAMATAYLAFASKSIGLYRVMFTDNHLVIRFDDGLARSSAAAFQELQEVVVRDRRRPAVKVRQSRWRRRSGRGCTGRPCWRPDASSPSAARAMKGEPRRRARPSPDC